MLNDFYANARVSQSIEPQTVSGTTISGSAVSTMGMEGVFNVIVNSSALTTGSVTGKVQFSGANGWADSAGTFNIVSGSSSSLVSSSYGDSRQGYFIRPVITVSGSAIVSAVVIAPSKDSAR